MTDIELITQYRNGSTEAFGTLYDMYVRRIYDFIYYKTHHTHTAEDLTSQTFMKALEHINDFDLSKGSFSSWLYTIARNTVIDFYRSKKEEKNIDDVWDLSEDSSIEKDADISIQISALEPYIKKLSSVQRDILTMRVWQDMSYNEIANIVGKSEANCKMIFSRTLSELRSTMPLILFIILILTKYK